MTPAGAAARRTPSLRPTTHHPAVGGPEEAEVTASLIRAGFDRYWSGFSEITSRARTRFEQGDWNAGQSDARERLELYRSMVAALVTDLGCGGEPGAHDHPAWPEVKRHYADRIAALPTVELAETFFNSVTRHVFTTVGVNSATEFVDFELGRIPSGLGDTPFRSYSRSETPGAMMRAMLDDLPFGLSLQDAEKDARKIEARVADAWITAAAPGPFETIEVLKPVFYRRKGAYVVGRVRGGNRVMPLVVALLNDNGECRADAVLVTEADVSVIFSFTHSYFQVQVDRPADTVAFLRTMMPAKPVAELYSALGFHKHGKTELYRELRRHLASAQERFRIAPGTPGMVMSVFTMPGLDTVFKVIRDRFPSPKRTTAEDVRRRYRLVFQHDRAGRLVDAQEFEHVAFSAQCFSPELLDELLSTASRTVTLSGDQITFGHLYTERRVKPLDLYLREADEASARRALSDYGQAIRELAATGVFPGDLLLKNFGVTRNGRVIFYDYDELSLLEACRFRDLPPALHPEDEMAAEPWFHVGPADVFPEEFLSFVTPNGAGRQQLTAEHGPLFTASFWRDAQSRYATGEMVDIFPYAPERRLRS